MPSGRFFSGSKLDVGTVTTPITITGTALPTIYVDATAFAGSAQGVIFVGVQTGSTLPRAIRVTTTGAQQVAVVGAVTIAPVYVNAATTIAATGTGILFIGVQSGATTSRAIMVTTTGAQHVLLVNTPTITASQGGTWSISTVSTLLGVVSVSGGGGGVQYSQGDTSIGATGTGTIFFGINATTARALAVHTTGGMIVAEMPAVGGGVQYPVGTTGIGATGTGTLFIGVNATTTKALVLSATGGISYVDTVNFIAAGSVNAVVTGTITALPSGTQDVIVIGTPTITGSVSVINTPTVTIGGTASAFILAGTLEVGGFRLVAHQSKISEYLSQTTATNAIVITSGAHTLYIQDILVSVETAMNIKFFSAATTKLGPLYFATQGGTRIQFIQPMVLNSNQSLTVTPSASGTCSVYADGYTVT